jgi:hypothetical protein
MRYSVRIHTVDGHYYDTVTDSPDRLIRRFRKTGFHSLAGEVPADPEDLDAGVVSVTFTIPWTGVAAIAVTELQRLADAPEPVPPAV